MKMSRLTVVLVTTALTAGCGQLPRVRTSTDCAPGAAESLVVYSLDSSGKEIAFAPLVIRGSSRAAAQTAATNSAGRAALTLPPGSYQVLVGAGMAEWQSAAAPVRVRPGCVVTARAQLIPYEIDPNTTRVHGRIGR